MRDPHRPLSQEPVGRLFGLGEHLAGGVGDRQALGERIHHLGPGERGRLLGQPLRAGQLLQDLVDLLSGRGSAALTAADLGELPLTHPLLRKVPLPALVDALLRLCVVLGRPCRHRRGAGRLDPRKALLGQPVVDLLRALAEALDQPPIVQPDDLGGARARIHRPPADPQPLGERRPLGRQVQVIGRHQMRVEPVAVQGRPASVRPLSGVLHQRVGVELRITQAAQPVLERHRQQSTPDVVAVGAVVITAHPDPVGLQVADADLERLIAGFGHLPADLVAAAGGQQRDALGAGEAVVEGLHPLVDPLPLVLPGPLKRLAVQ